MRNKISVKIHEYKTIHEIKGFWTDRDFIQLLDALEFDDPGSVAPSDLKDMCLMALQDLPPEEAAYTVLKHVLGDALRDGQLRSMANEMRDEMLWNEYVDPAFHERLFCIGSLLFMSAPGTFPQPDAANFQLELLENGGELPTDLAGDISDAGIVRVLSHGIPENAVLHRFFGDQLQDSNFADADRIVWTSRKVSSEPGRVVIDIVGSLYWLQALEHVDSFSALVGCDG